MNKRIVCKKLKINCSLINKCLLTVLSTIYITIKIITKSKAKQNLYTEYLYLFSVRVIDEGRKSNELKKERLNRLQH